MAGTHCISGDILGVVIATGNRSVFGQVSQPLSAHFPAVITPYANVQFAHSLQS